jgi:hypothetical protein
MRSSSLFLSPARRSPVALADAEAKPLSLLTSMRTTLAYYPFRLFAGIQFLSQCYGTHLTSNISLYMVRAPSSSSRGTHRPDWQQ